MFNLVCLQLEKIEELPLVTEMTLEMARVYFPPLPPNDDMPSMFPFTRNQQPNVDPKEFKSNFLLPKSLWERNISEDKRYLW